MELAVLLVKKCGSWDGMLWLDAAYRILCDNLIASEDRILVLLVVWGVKRNAR